MNKVKNLNKQKLEIAKTIEQQRIKTVIENYEAAAHLERQQNLGLEKAEQALLSISFMVADCITALMHDKNLNNSEKPFVKFFPGDDALIVELLFSNEGPIPDYIARFTFSAVSNSYKHYIENVNAANVLLRFDQTLNLKERQNLKLILNKVNSLHTLN